MARPQKRTPSGSKEKQRLGNAELAEIVRSVLELPVREKKLPRRIVRAVFEAIAKGLQKGETVRVNGLGTFKLIRRNGTRRLKIWVNGPNHKTQIEADVKHKNRVAFVPAISILADIDGQTVHQKRHLEARKRHYVCD